MNAKMRQQLAKRKSRVERRLDKERLGNTERPVFTAANIFYEFADCVHGISHGGIGAFHLLAQRIGLIDAIYQDICSSSICPTTKPIMFSTSPITPYATVLVCKTASG